MYRQRMGIVKAITFIPVLPRFETKIDMRIFDALEESSKTGTVPSDTSGFTIAMGVDLSQHTLSYFEGKVSE